MVNEAARCVMMRTLRPISCWLLTAVGGHDGHAVGLFDVMVGDFMNPLTTSVATAIHNRFEAPGFGATNRTVNVFAN